MVFPAGALVHHRYRTEEGNGRSCIIAAFHLCSENPGSFAKSCDNGPTHAEESLFEFMISHQSGDTSKAFLTLLEAEAECIENKLCEIYASTGASELLNTDAMRLSDEELVKWRRSVIYAPSPAAIKLSRNIYLSSAETSIAAGVLDKLTSVMMFDKHGLLQLILCEDSREEIRKLSRKRLGEMKQNEIASRLEPWMEIILEKPFSAQDLPGPAKLQALSGEVGALADTVIERVTGMKQRGYQADYSTSLRRLIFDLAEAITRCEKFETFISTSLFLFWTTDELIMALEDPGDIAEAREKGAVFLRNYVASVLLLERSFGSA